MSKNVTVAISSDFLESFAKLPRKVQSKTSSFIVKFKNDPLSSGINYEKINSADKNLCSVRIDDTYRGVVMRQKEEGVYLLLWVDHHDEAYDWARRRKVAVNPKTGVLQVYEVVDAGTLQMPKQPGIFDGVSDDHLVELGVPADLIDYVRSLIDDSQFFGSKNILPADVYENLAWLQNGIPVSEVLEMVRDAAEGSAADAGDSVGAALARPDSLRSFMVVEGEDELFQVLSAPLEKWRVFLHPSQRKLVKRKYNGPARVLGSAGTGKTVVAMHRARHLSASSQECLPLVEGRQRILFTTFSSTLAADIAANMQKISTKDELRRMDIVNLDSWVSRFLRENEMDFKIEYEESVLQDIWKKAVSDSGTTLDLETSFYSDEWAQVILAQEINDLAAYSHAKRTGRGIRLNRKQRMEVWKVAEEYRKQIKSLRIRDVDFAMSECAGLVRRAHPDGMYDHVIVDEGQDFSAPAFRLIRALAGPERENDIFIVGDARQRIYRRKAVLSQCGIKIVGRSSILRINYRTTEEIRRRAVAVLEGVGFDDLDGGSDDDPKAQSLLHGQDPEVKGFKSQDDELAYISEEIRKLAENEVDLRDVCIVARTRKLLNSYAHYLQKDNIPVCELKSRKPDDRKVEGVRVASMHRIKGLEFDHVFIVDASDGVLPPYAAIRAARQQETLDELIREEKSLLYVSMTRAKKSTSISYSGKASQLL